MDMTEEFKNRATFIHWFIICALANVDINDTLRAKPREVTMQINGVEINPKKALLRVEDAYKQLAEERAKEMIEDIKGEILEPFRAKVEEMTEALDILMEDKLDNIGK